MNEKFPKKIYVRRIKGCDDLYFFTENTYNNVSRSFRDGEAIGVYELKQIKTAKVDIHLE